MLELIDKKVVVSCIVGAVAAVVLSKLVNAFLPDSVPGAAVVKDTLSQAAN